MLSGSGTKVLVDQLFNVLLIFVCLLFLTAISMKMSEEQEQKNADNDNNILITMRWETNNDMDLWLRLPNGKMVGYPSRDVPPAHLDVDVVEWRKYFDGEGEQVITLNEEIITIRGIMEGEYVVNTFYFDSGDGNANINSIDIPVKTEIVVQDVQNKKVIFYDKRVVFHERSETHFVKFTIRKDPHVSKGYTVEEVYTDRPTFFLKHLVQRNPDPGGFGPSW